MGKLKNWLWHNKEGAIIGGVIGLLIFIYDYGFFMNPGGSDHLISNWIRTTLNLYILTPGEGSSMIVVFGPGIILILTGIIIGAFIDSIWRPGR